MSKIKNPAHPMQPLVKDEHGTLRFKKNEIVNFLFEYATSHGFDMNNLVLKVCKGEFSKADFSQLNQLIGYPVCGYCDLSQVPEKHKDKAWAKMQSFNEEEYVRKDS
jgi:hypothetical protein